MANTNRRRHIGIDYVVNIVDVGDRLFTETGGDAVSAW